MAACTPATPQRPSALDIDVPADWRAVTDSAPSAAAPSFAGWLADFSSAHLDALVAEALERNRDLQAAAARLDQARALARIAGADRWPSLSAGASAARSQLSITGPAGNTAAVRQSRYSLSLNASWEADIWGRVAAEDAAGMADYQAARENYAGARLSLVGQVAQTWFTLISVSQRKALAQKTVDSYERSLTIVRSRYARGITTALDVRLAISNLASAKALLVQRTSELEKARRALEILLGRYPAAEMRADADLPKLSAAVPAGLPSDLLNRRPDILAARARLLGGDYRAAAAKRNLLPSLQLTASGGNEVTDFGRLFDFDDLVWRLAASLTQPIFQGGRLAANADLEKARRDENLQNYARTILTAFQDVENALADEIYLARQQEHIAEAADEAAAAQALAEQQYSSGLTEILNLLDAQRRNLDAQGQYLDIRLARLNNRVRLYLALGGNFDETPLKQARME